MTNSMIGPEPVRVAEVPGRSMLILYGSETGNSQDIAEEIGRDAQRLHFKTRVDEMNGAQLSTLLQYTLVVFVISTTGQGDMPRNSGAFWRSLLRKKLPPGCLSAVRFTTFGLGDSMYIKFNWAARKLHKRLEQLGAVEFYPRGEADEQDSDGVDERYMPWAADLRKKLLDLYPLPEGLAPIPDDALLPPRYTVGLALSPDERHSQSLEQSPGSYPNCYGVEAVTQEPQSKGADTDATDTVENLIQKTTSITITEDHSSTNEVRIPSQEPREVEQPSQALLPIPGGLDASLELNQRVTPETHFQDVRLIRLALDTTSSGPPSIQPFDSLTIYPKNFPQDVQKLIDLMGWSTIADSPLSFAPTTTSSSDAPPGQPSLPRGLHVDPHRPTTLRDLLTHNLDITCTPRRSFLKDMSYFSSDEYHRQRLLEFTMREYTDEFFDYTTRPRRTILEVLEEFTSVQIPLARVLDMFPVMRGRDFSIASVDHHDGHHDDTYGPFSPSPKQAAASTTSVTLLVALVKYKTILRKTRQGLCSRYLESLTRAGTPIRVALNRSSASLHGPAHACRPLCAVATGTGVAPLRLFVEERLSHASSGEARVGDTAVFFGNRSRDADFHFRDVWEDLKARYAAAAETRDPAGPGGNFDVHTAFSRDPSAPRQYVQDVIRQHAPTVRAMVAADAIFVVCGGSLKMARAVKEAVRDCLRGNAEKYPDNAAVDAAFAGLTWWEEIW
ncbi:flavodoxin [Colletotrichum eremochloae]|nr:flavodoxin [Colletotrichum eremochloae]